MEAKVEVLKSEIKNMTLEELLKLRQIVEDEIKARKAKENGTVRVKFESGFVDLRKGKGWAAILKVNANGEIEREFIDINRIWGKGGFKFTFEIDVPVGTIIEISEGGSWKNKYRWFGEVQADGSLENIGWADTIAAKKKVFEKLGATRFAKPSSS